MRYKYKRYENWVLRKIRGHPNNKGEVEAYLDGFNWWGTAIHVDRNPCGWEVVAFNSIIGGGGYHGFPVDCWDEASELYKEEAMDLIELLPIYYG